MEAAFNSPDSAGLLVTYAGNHLCNCVFKPTLNSQAEPSVPEHVSPFYRTCEQIAKLQKTLEIKLKENLFEIC